MRDREDIAPLQTQRDFAQLGDPHTAGPCGADQRADTGADDAAGTMAALEQRLEHAHMGEPLHAAAAQHEGVRCVSLHVVVPLACGVKFRVT